MEQNLSFTQQLSQQQKLSQQTIQAINLLSVPTLELSEKIYEEVEKNPALEIVKDASVESVSVKLNSSKNDAVSSSSDSDVFQSFLESSPSRNETLQEHLLLQLHISSLSDEEKSIAEKIIQSLDNRGYFTTPLEELFSDFYQPVENSVDRLVDNSVNNSVENFSPVLISDFSVDKKVWEVLNKIQKFDPVGVICKNLQESLELQARSKLFLSENKFENEDYIDVDEKTKDLILEILHSHFDLLEKPRANLIQKKLNEKGIDCTLSQVETSLEFIRSLDPYPAREFSTENPIFIRPDVFIRQLSQEEIREANDEELKKYPFVVELIKTNLPTVKISKDFIDYQNNNPQIKKAVNDAKNFLNAIHQRNLTLLKTSIEIVKYQIEFFEKGPLYLKPLRLKDIAEKIDVHETTVSRISNAKYIQCEWGLFEIKYFFSNAVNVQSKDAVSDKDNSSNKNQNSQEKILSKESIKQELLSILQEEEGKNLSDQKLSDKLAQRGINIARRTVAKYRKELNFDSSYDR